MTRSELLAEVSLHAGMSRREVARAMDAFTHVTKETVRAGECVTLPGFGVFYPLDIEPKKLFAGARMSPQRRKIRFRQSRRRS